MHRLLASIAVLGAVSGCRGDPSDPSFLARDSADVRILEWPRPEDLAEELRLVELPFESPLPEFGDILDVAPLPGNRLAVLDPMGPHVVVLDSTGAEVLRFGGEGDGPAEFRATGLTELVALDDAIVVPDILRQRITLFDFDGRARASLPVPVDDGLAMDWRSVDGDGLILRRVSEPQRLETIAPPAPGFHRAGDLSFLSLPSQSGPLLPLPVWCRLGDGRIVVGRTDAYALRILDSGRTTVLLRRGLAERPLGDSDFGHLEHLLRESLSRRLGSIVDPAMARALLERTPLPERAPLISRLMCSPRGELWVERARPVSEMGVDVLRVGSTAGWGGGSWDVFDVDRETLWRIELPEGAQLTRVTERMIVGYITDGYGRKWPARWARGLR